jgi:SPP1 family predicted phage head-tail adaptor
MLAAGKLRHRIRIEQPAQAQDSATGAITETWATFADNIPAAIEDLSGRDYIQSAAMQSEVTTRITIRYMDGVKPNMRVVAEDATYQIRAAMKDKESRREYITLMCDEVLG